MSLDKYCIVYDFETDGLDTDSCNPVEIGAIAIDLRNLEIVENSEFQVNVCPDQINEPDYIKNNYRTIKWHADLNKTTPAKIVEGWKTNGIKESTAWKSFIDYCKKYKIGTGFSQTPICGGQNILDFDIPIARRLCSKHKVQYPFSNKETFDLLKITPLWFMFSKSPPKNYKLDTLREYFSLSTDGAHTAIHDVRQCAQLLIMFLKLHKTLTPRIEMLNREKFIEDEPEVVETQISDK